MADIVRLDTCEKYSEAVVHNGVVYLTGQVADGPAVDGDIKVQAKSVFEQIDALLARCNSSKDRILRAEIFLTDIGDFSGMNEVWLEWMRGVATPARATVGTSALVNPKWKIEVIVTAAVKPIAHL